MVNCRLIYVAGSCWGAAAAKKGNPVVKKSVLVVEDDEDIRKLVSYTLLKEGFQVAGVASGEEALSTTQSQPPDLVLLDLMLPGMDGLTVCKKFRSNPQTAKVAIVILTAKGEEVDIVAGLNAGANDYITKPFSRNVLIARVRAALRNTNSGTVATPEPDESDGILRIHNLAVHPGKHLVTVDDEPVELSATEFRVLQALARKPGWVFTRQQILDAVHGDVNYAVTDRAVDVQILALRRKLGPAGKYVETVRGVGYRFKE